VPTGNFGDVFAGYVAAQMGLPIERLIVATNVNDILHRALSSGDYSAGTVTPTAAPSMDIQVSSNFERLLADLAGSSVAEQMHGFESSKAMRLTNAQREGAARIFASDRIDARRDERGDALGLGRGGAGDRPAYRDRPGRRAPGGLPADVPIVTLATAHPAKFADAVERATGVRPALPARVGDLFDRQERYDVLPGTLDAVRDYIAERAKPRA
jgi:threonine synthase